MRAACPGVFFLFLLLLLFSSAGCDRQRQVQIPVDGETLDAIYWEPRDDLSPGVLLIPEVGGHKEDWIPLALRFQRHGYGILAIEFRQGEVAGRDHLQADVKAGFAFLREQKRVDAARLGVIGVGSGAESALALSAVEATIQALVLVSPLEQGDSDFMEAAMRYYGSRPVLLVAGLSQPHAQRVEELTRRGRGTVVVKQYEGEARGLALLGATPELEREILDFLDLHLAAPVLDTYEGGG